MNTPQIIDISWPITEDMTAYKNKHVVAYEHIRNFQEHAVRESLVRLGSHTGTHVDAPAHFVHDGVAIEQIPLDLLCGRAQVVDCRSSATVIMAHDLAHHTIHSGDIILLKTRNSERSATADFDPEFVYLHYDAARYLVDQGVRAVGIDYLGIERNQPGHETHTALLAAGIPIIEGLRLAHVASGFYQLICLPLAIVGLEAAVARAILIANQ